MAKRPGELTDKQERFCLNLFSGMSQRESYIQAGYSDSALPATIDRAAFELVQSPKISTRLAELRKAAEDKAIGTVVERQQILTSIYRTDESAKHRISAISEHNKMTGVYDTKTVINNININAVQIEDAKADGKFREVIDATE